MEDKNHFNCIYMYINKINDKKYVGKTIDFNKRHKQHLNSNKSLLERAIKKYSIENFDIKILYENIDDENILNEMEKYFILKYNTFAKTGNGYNLAEGGKGGNVTIQWTEERMNEFKEKMSNITKGRKSHMKGKYGELHPQYGTHLSEETKEKIRQANIGRKHTEEELEKMRNWRENNDNPMKNKKHSKDSKKKISETRKNNGCAKGEKNPSAKKVAQYDLYDNLIKVWECVQYASNELEINNSSICKCAKGKIKTAGGFKWKYIEK